MFFLLTSILLLFLLAYFLSFNLLFHPSHVSINLSSFSLLLHLHPSLLLFSLQVSPLPMREDSVAGTIKTLLTKVTNYRNLLFILVYDRLLLQKILITSIIIILTVMISFIICVFLPREGGNESMYSTFDSDPLINLSPFHLLVSIYF